jgi:hypothetical protein
MHAGPFDVKSPGGAYSSTGSTFEAFVHVSLDILGHGVHNDTPTLKVTDATIVIITALTLKFHDHHTFTAGVDGGLENIES